MIVMIFVIVNLEKFKMFVSQYVRGFYFCMTIFLIDYFDILYCVIDLLKVV